MKLALWTYEGPPHVGAMRIATAMRDVHYVLHAPQGDTYADLLFTMIERRKVRPPVTYTTFQARDLGGDTAELFKRAAREAFERFAPRAMMVGASCTAELIQDDPGGLANALGLPIPVVLRFDYHGAVPGARERAVAHCERVKAAIEARYSDLCQQGLLHTLLTVRDRDRHVPAETVSSSITFNTGGGH